MVIDPFWFILAGLLGIQAYLRSRRPRERARRAFARARNVPIGLIVDGQRACVTGTVGAAGAAMTSPIGGHSCVAFRLEVKRADDEDGYSPALTRDGGGAFSITDDTGTLQVEGPFLVTFHLGSGWADVPHDDLDFLEEEGVKTTGTWGDTAFVYREWLLEPGDTVSVLGLAFLEPDPTRASAGFRSAPLVPRMRGSAREPVVIGDAIPLQGR